MRRTTILNAEAVRRKPFNEAKYEFLKHCRIKNLRPRTITYYEEADHISLIFFIYYNKEHNEREGGNLATD